MAVNNNVIAPGAHFSLLDPQPINPEVVCGICFDPFGRSRLAYAHGAGNGHLYHIYCISAWAENSPTCPTCRIVITHINGRTIIDHIDFLARQRSELEIAFDMGQSNRVKNILKTFPFSEDERIILLTRAIEANHQPMVKAVLKSGSFGQTYSYQAIDLAVEEMPQVLPLLLRFLEVGLPKRTEMIMTAARVGQVIVAKTCLELGPIDDFERCRVFRIVAIKRLEPEIVRAVLLNGNIPERSISTPILETAERQDMAMMRVYCETGAISNDLRGRSLAVAAGKGNLEMVHLLNKGEISRTQLKFAITAAAEIGNMEILNVLLLHKRPDELISPDAVLGAAKNGHLMVLQVLLARVELSEIDRGHVVIGAAENGHFQIVHILLETGPISNGHRIVTYAWTFENNQNHICAFLLQMGPIAEVDLGEELVRAARVGEDKLVVKLLQIGTISQTHLDAALKRAANRNYGSVVHELLKRGLVSQESRDSVLMTAISDHYLNMVAILLQKGPYTDQNLCTKVIEAAKAGNLEGVRAILNSNPISAANRSHIESLLAHERLDIQSILSQSQISNESRGMAVIEASKNGTLTIVQTLFQDGPISPGHHNKAILEAGGCKDIEMILFLLSSATDDQKLAVMIEAIPLGYSEIVKAILGSIVITESYRGNAVFEAVSHGHLQIMDTLLLNGPISDADRGAAVKMAVEKEHFLILSILLARGRITPQDRGMAVIQAAENESLETIKVLLPDIASPNVTISDFDRGEATKKAAELGNLEIVRLLVISGDIPANQRNEAIRLAERMGHRAVALELQNVRNCNLM